MSTEGPASSSGSEGQGPRRSASRVWRVLAVAGIVVATVALAHFLFRPGGWTESAGGPPGPRAGSPARPEEPSPSAQTAHQPVARASESEWAEAKGGLRRVLAGILMAAQEGDDTEAESRRTLLAERFGLPSDYPRSEVPADLLPDGAQVLAVFDHPEREGTRMVLVRMDRGLGETLSAFQKRYVADGWEAGPAEASGPRGDSGGPMDRGWLIWFCRGRDHRVVFAQPRGEGEETLAAVCDLRY